MLTYCFLIMWVSSITPKHPVDQVITKLKLKRNPTFDFYFSENTSQCCLPLFLVFLDTWGPCMRLFTQKVGVVSFDQGNVS